MVFCYVNEEIFGIHLSMVAGCQKNQTHGLNVGTFSTNSERSSVNSGERKGAGG